MPPMTARRRHDHPSTVTPLELLDALERHRRREYVSARAALIRLLTDPGGSISGRPALDPHNENVNTVTPTAMTLQDVSDELQVSLATTKRLVRVGKLRTVKVEGTTRVLRVDFAAYLATLTEGEN